MGCRGVLFAIEKSEVDALLAFKDEEELVDHVHEELEERELGGPWAAETDKAWDALHRCFDNGKLTLDGGEYPLNHIIFGGRQLCTSGEFYIALKTPDQVRDVAAKIGAVSREELKSRYRRIKPKAYGFPLTDEDEEYTWQCLVDMVAFYQHAAKAGRWVIFTVAQ